MRQFEFQDQNQTFPFGTVLKMQPNTSPLQGPDAHCTLEQPVCTVHIPALAHQHPKVFPGRCGPKKKKKKKSCLGHEVLVCWLKSGGIMGSWVCAFVQIPFLGGVTLNKTWPQVSTSSLRSQPLRADMRSSGGLLWLGDGGLAASGY